MPEDKTKDDTDKDTSADDDTGLSDDDLDAMNSAGDTWGWGWKKKDGDGKETKDD